MTSLKSIFEYENFREFLRAFYASSKAKDKKFSLGYFSKAAGFKSRSVLRQVMAGERNIALHSIDKFAKALKLNRTEANFFRALVLLNQASNPEDKRRFAEEILKFKKFREAHPLAESQFNYFNKWYYVVIRELTSMPEFRADPEWIAKMVKPAISVNEAKRALQELVQLGFIKFTQGGRFEIQDGWLSTADEVSSSSIVNYHREMLQRASEAISQFPREKRDISAQTFAVSFQTAKKIKEMIQNFRKEVEKVAGEDRSGEAVFQLNFQLFPVSETLPGDKRDEK